MTIKLGIISDPISGFNIKKDTGFAMMLAAQQRGYELYYMEMNDSFLVPRRCQSDRSKSAGI